MFIYQPYTYYIRWSCHNTWYYGVRWAQNCNPEEFWKTYFTSSKYVKQYRKKYGDPDIIQIRKIFNNKIKAIEWEHKVLRRMRVETRMNSLNQTSNKCIYDKYNRGSESLKKYNVLESTRNKSRERLIHNNPMKNPEVVKKMLETKSKRDYTESYKNRKHGMLNPEVAKKHADSLIGRKWYNNGIEEKCVHMPINGWNRGRLKISFV